MRVQFAARGTIAGPPARRSRSIGVAAARMGRATEASMVEKSILMLCLKLLFDASREESLLLVRLYM